MSKASTVREIWDEMSLNVSTFLQGHASVSKLSFQERSSVPATGISSWERAHQPLTLPEDLCNFLQISNGIQLRWDVKCLGETTAMGCMQLNQISAMTEIKLNLNDDEAWMEVMMGHGDLVEPHATLAEISQESWQKARQARMSFRAFDLDSSCQSGKVALLYCQGNDNPQIWFQDLSCKWYFLCKTFSDYFRLLVMHLGLPNWHYSFTEVGLDPASKHWFRLLSPERLAIDLEAARELNAHRRVMRGEVVGARNEGGVDDVQAGGAGAAEEGATSVGALQLDLASLDQMRDLNPKKKAAQGALAAIQQQDNNDRWAQRSSTAAEAGGGGDDTAAVRRVGRETAAADKKSSRPWSASAREASGRGARSSSQALDGRPQGVRPATASSRRKPT